ncbi:MAG TPA: hypothetical protein PKD86_04575 [Gemmatales bacterium]|nr:hypothetical protein [Gemmatales bacterium]HMP58608.1 hypothetical protein [Gemmatales bacterium]
MQRLSRLQRRILALLEEAGEDSLGTLINTVAIPKGSPDELLATQKALKGLVGAGLIQLGFELRPISYHTTLLSSKDATRLLDQLDNAMQWSPAVGYWIGREGVPLYNVQVTDSGYETAKTILEEDGWPTQPLPGYE